MKTTIPSCAVTVCLLLLVAAPASALDRYAFGLGFFGSAGGTLGGDPDADLDNLGFQVAFSWQTQIRTYLMVRAGQMELEVDEGGGLLDSDLSWLTIAGEYRFTDTAWDSGLFLGLGAYEQSGSPLLPDDTAVGLTLGTTARFQLTRRLDILLELVGHFTDLDATDTFATGNVGLQFRF